MSQLRKITVLFISATFLMRSQNRGSDAMIHSLCFLSVYCTTALTEDRVVNEGGRNAAPLELIFYW